MAPSVLVVDDDPNLVRLMSKFLTLEGFAPIPAANGAEAIAKIEVEDFDLVLSDIKMPDKTGYDVFAAARKKNNPPPVILMTGFGYDPNHSIVRASQEGLQAVRPQSANRPLPRY